jgi:predicted naringenin-chalcone synthase
MTPRRTKSKFEGHAFITGFQAISPRFRTSQRRLLSWLVDAHTVLGNADRERISAWISRYSASADHIAYRSHELPDFRHRSWDRMRLFSPRGSNVVEKTQFFNETVATAFERMYPAGSAAPEALVHVTCTGYSAPSGAQKLVSSRGWGRQTQVVHAYHMGCYAAHPALRIATGQMAFSSSLRPSVDIVHTELCSLHFDPSLHDPGQLVIQSLFADGYMKYQLTRTLPIRGASMEILALQDEIIPDSMETMNWTPGPMIYAMTLSKEVPTKLASALVGFVQRLLERAGLDSVSEKATAVFAIHPGGPRIIELAEKVLNLDSVQTAWSRKVLQEHGNMSSATLPHIWQQILQDKQISEGTLIVSIGAGPGLTLSGALFRKR